MLRKLYDWILARAASPRAELWLAVISFVDGAILPLPPEMLQIPMAISRPAAAPRVALIGALSSAAGALAGYAVGLLFYTQLAVPLLTITGHLEKFQEFLHAVGQNSLLWPLAFCVTPQLAAMAAGTVPLGLAATVAGSIIGRGSRFLIVALLLKYFGKTAQAIIERYFHIVALAVAGLIAAFVLVKYAF